MSGIPRRRSLVALGLSLAAATAPAAAVADTAPKTMTPHPTLRGTIGRRLPHPTMVLNAKEVRGG